MVFVRLKQGGAARGLLLLSVLGGLLTLIGWNWYRQDQAVTIQARTPETGGWAPAALTAQVGEPLSLRLISDDVMHSFMVGQVDMEPVDLPPGIITDVTLLFDEPGTYTYYCTRICSPNHWRMRGTIEVTEDKARQPEPVEPPQFVTLGFDIDAPHPAEKIPDVRPSSTRGEALAESIPAAYLTRNLYESQTPEQVWRQLKNDPAAAGLGDADIWDLVAWLWQSNSTKEILQTGQALYTINCASCHGQSGDGMGPLAGLQPTAVPDFTDSAFMLGANSIILEGKILRGGMGTGMPNWGTIFTDAEIGALVDYLWTFQFDTEGKTK